MQRRLARVDQRQAKDPVPALGREPGSRQLLCEQQGDAAAHLSGGSDDRHVFESFRQIHSNPPTLALSQVVGRLRPRPVSTRILLATGILLHSSIRQPAADTPMRTKFLF